MKVKEGSFTLAEIDNWLDQVNTLFVLLRSKESVLWIYCYSEFCPKGSNALPLMRTVFSSLRREKWNAGSSAAIHFVGKKEDTKEKDIEWASEDKTMCVRSRLSRRHVKWRVIRTHRACGSVG